MSLSIFLGEGLECDVSNSSWGMLVPGGVYVCDDSPAVTENV